MPGQFPKAASEKKHPEHARAHGATWLTHAHGTPDLRPALIAQVGRMQDMRRLERDKSEVPTFEPALSRPGDGTAPIWRFGDG